MNKLILLLTLTAGLPGYSQGWKPVGSRSSALGGASICLDDVWAFHHNPGALANLKTFSAGAYYETRFLTRELQTQAIAVAVPLKKGVISAGAQLYGYEQYRTTRTGLGYSMALGEKISAGVQVNLQHLRLGNNYGSSASATFEAGILAELTEKWKLGASVMNVGRQRIASLDDRFTSVLRIGTLYAPSGKVNVLFEVEKQVIHPFSFKGAVEYLPGEHFALRFGAHSGPAEFSFGAGYRNNGFFIDAGTSYHPVLGWTPHFGLTYQLQRNAAN